MNTNQSDKDESAGDLLKGAAKIKTYLVELGMPEEKTDVYYAKRAGIWPIGKIGGSLIASKKQLKRHAQKITAPTS